MIAKFIPDNPYRRSLELSWKEGIPASLMLAVIDYYLIPLGLYLGAASFQIGLLVAIPNLLGALALLSAVKLVDMVGSRLHFLTQGALVQSWILVPIALLPFVKVPGRLIVLIVLVAGFRVLGNLIGTVWGSLTSDYLSPEDRGKYFGWRSQVTSLSGLAGLLLGGSVLFLMRPWSEKLGFVFLFLFAAFMRFISSRLLGKMQGIPLERKKESDFTFREFIAQHRTSNFMKFVLFIAGMTFATHIAASYFSVYMLRDLRMNYLAYTSVLLAATLTGLISFPVWGRHADLAGNAKILKITSLLVPCIPFLWLFSKNPFYIMGVEAFSGFVWGGFNLCAVNYIYDAVSSEKRVRCLSYFNLINGIALFLGASLGGFLAGHLPALWGSRFLTLFCLSGAARFLVYFLLADRFREVRENASPVSSLELFFSVVGIRPLVGPDREIDVLAPPKKAPGKDQTGSKPCDCQGPNPS